MRQGVLNRWSVQLFGTKTTLYNDAFHTWYLRGQAKKMRAEVLKDLKCLGIRTAAEMKAFMNNLKRLLPGTVTSGTSFVALCEFRQAVNKFGLAVVLGRAVERGWWH